jgi:hypothetical protein
MAYMAGRDNSSSIDESSSRRLVRGDKGCPITGFKDNMTMATPRIAAPKINNIPLHRKAISVICTHPFFRIGTTISD